LSDTGVKSTSNLFRQKTGDEENGTLSPKPASEPKQKVKSQTQVWAELKVEREKMLEVAREARKKGERATTVTREICFSLPFWLPSKFDLEVQEDEDSEHKFVRTAQLFLPNFSSKHLEGKDTESHVPAILQKKFDNTGDIKAIHRRIDFEERLMQRHLEEMSAGAILTKYKKKGPNKRWFFVSPSGDTISWQKVGKNTETMSKEERKKKFGAQTLNPMGTLQGKVLSLFTGRVSTKYLADIVGMYYGPHWSQGFDRYITKKDGAKGKPWLCFTVDFTGRSLDLVCPDQKTLTVWFLGMQALAPLSRFHFTLGALMWQRLVMKINFYGLANFIQTKGAVDLDEEDRREF